MCYGCSMATPVEARCANDACDAADPIVTLGQYRPPAVKWAVLYTGSEPRVSWHAVELAVRKIRHWYTVEGSGVCVE